MRISKTWKLPAAVLAFGLIATACSDTTTPDDEATEGATDAPDDDATDAGTGTAAGSTAQQVIDRGSLICGVSGGLVGFSFNDNGSYSGLDVDYCRGVAAAVLGNPDAVTYVDLTSATRFTALQAAEVDVLIRNGTWTAGRDGTLGLQWTTTTYYDGQGILVNADDPAQSVADMNDYTVCVQVGTTTERNLTTYFEDQGVSYSPVNTEDEVGVEQNFSAGTCDAYTTDRSGLASFKSTYTGGEVRILPDVMSKEPLGPAVREDDIEWFDIVNWVVLATFQAEEFGITSANVDSFDFSTNARAGMLLGDPESLEGNTPGTDLGFPDEEWAKRVISAVGNYQEIFDRNIVPIGLDEGLNQLYTEGGLHYAPPYIP